MTADPPAPGRGLPVYEPATAVLPGTWSVPFRLRPRSVIGAFTAMAGIIRLPSSRGPGGGYVRGGCGGSAAPGDEPGDREVADVMAEPVAYRFLPSGSPPMVFVDRAAKYLPALHRRVQRYDDRPVMIGRALLPGLVHPMSVIVPGVGPAAPPADGLRRRSASGPCTRPAWSVLSVRHNSSSAQPGRPCARSWCRRPGRPRRTRRGSSIRDRV